RMAVLVVASLLAVGMLFLLRGVVGVGSEEGAVAVGSWFLVVAFVALTLLAQDFGQLRAGGGLDHSATLPVPPAAVVLGAAGA
ncbi:ABC transporter permease, partial [Streptomyces sp. DT9]